MNFLESLLHLDLPRPFVEACASGYTAIFEAKETKMEKAIKAACKIAGVKDEGGGEHYVGGLIEVDGGRRVVKAIPGGEDWTF